MEKVSEEQSSYYRFALAPIAKLTHPDDINAYFQAPEARGGDGSNLMRRRLLRVMAGTAMGLAVSGIASPGTGILLPTVAHADSGYRVANLAKYPATGYSLWSPTDSSTARKLGQMTMYQTGSGPDAFDQFMAKEAGYTTYARQWAENFARTVLTAHPDQSTYHGHCRSLAILGQQESDSLIENSRQSFITRDQAIQLGTCKYDPAQVIAQFNDPPSIEAYLQFYLNLPDKDRRPVLVDLPSINGAHQVGVWFRNMVGISEDLRSVLLRNWDNTIVSEPASSINQIQFAARLEWTVSNPVDPEETSSWGNPIMVRNRPVIDYLALGAPQPTQYNQ